MPFCLPRSVLEETVDGAVAEDPGFGEALCDRSLALSSSSIESVLPALDSLLMGSSMVIPMVGELPLLAVRGDLSDGEVATGLCFTCPIK